MILKVRDLHTPKGFTFVKVDDYVIKDLKPYKLRIITHYPGTSSERKAVSIYVNGKNVLLHRFLLQAPKGTQVDHINRDTLDNRLANLRFVTAHQNMINRSISPATGYSNVYEFSGKIFVQIIKGNLLYRVTGFSSTKDASRVARKLETIL